MLEKKNYLKLSLDIIIALIFVLLFNARVLGGLPFHEIAGLGIGLAFLVHLLLNSQWVKTVTRRLFDRKLPAKTRFGYFLNVLLLILMIIIIVSGLMISKVIFPYFRSVDQRWFQDLHLSISYLTLVLVGIHVGLHGQWLMSMMKNIFRVQSSKMTFVLAKVCIVVVILYGGSQIFATQVTSRVAQIGTAFSMNSQQIPTDEFKGGIEGRGSSRKTYGAKLSGGKGAHVDGVNPTGVILNYSGIIGVFAIITYYGETVLGRRKTS